MSKVSDKMLQPTDFCALSQSKPVKVIAVSAGKGGVGKSNVSVNLAVALAQKNKKVLLLDADLGLANIDIMLGLRSQYNLSHVVRGVCQLNDILLQDSSGICVIPAASGTEYMAQLSKTEHAGIIDSFNELTDEIDYLIIDTAAGISDTALSFARSSQEIIVVICDEPASITDTYAFIKIMASSYEWNDFHVLVNMTRSLREGPELFNKLDAVAEQFLDVRLNYLGTIPFDEQVHHAVKRQKPVLIAYPNSYAAKAFLQLAEVVDDWPYKSVLRGNTSFFIERFIVPTPRDSFASSRTQPLT